MKVKNKIIFGFCGMILIFCSLYLQPSNGIFFLLGSIYWIIGLMSWAVFIFAPNENETISLT